MYVVVEKSGEFAERDSVLLGVFESMALVEAEFGAFEARDGDPGEYVQDLSTPGTYADRLIRECYEVKLNHNHVEDMYYVD